MLMTLCIGLGVATWVATGVLNRGLEAASRQASTPLTGEADFYVGNGDAGLRRVAIEQVARTPGVRAVQPLVIQRVVLPEFHHRPALLLGIDLPEQRDSEQLWTVKANDVTPQLFMRSMLLRQHPVVVGEELARSLPPGASFGVLIAGQVQRLRSIGTISARGRASALGGNVLLMRSDDAAELLGHPDHVSRLDVALEPGTDRADVRRRLEEELGSSAQVTCPESHDQRIQDMLGGLKVGFSLCGAGALVVGLFLIYSVLAVTVVERGHDIGILRSLGATRPQIGSLFLGEAAVLGVTGGLIGIPMGLGLAHFTVGPMQQALCDIFLPLQLKQLEPGTGTLLGGLVAGLGTAMLAAVVPALQAALDCPSEALRRVPPARGASRRMHLAGCLIVTALGIACFVFKEHLPGRFGSFGSLVLVLLGILLAMPLLTTLVARLMRGTARFPLGLAGRMAVDDLARAPGRTGVVIAAVSAGVALLFQTAGLIRSNEDAIRDWVDRSIAGDLFVTAGGPLCATGQTLPMAEAVGEKLARAFPGVGVVPMRFRYLDWRRNGRVNRILLLALDAQSYYDANENRRPPLPELESYRQLSQPGTVLVSENFAELHGVRVGNMLVLPGSEGPVALRVIGTVIDYSCNHGTVIVDRAQYRSQFDAGLVDVLDVYVPPGMNAEAVRQRVLQSPWGTEQALCVLSRSEVRRHILGMVSRLYGLAYTQEFVVGIVAILGLVITLFVSVLQRRRELGILRAAGATRAQVLRVVLCESLLLGLIGLGIGMLIGLPLEWYTVRFLQYEESGFLCTVSVPWAAAGAVALLTVAGSALASLAPGVHAARMQVTEAIAYE